MVKRIYFFKGDSYFEYDPRPGTDRVVKGPISIDTRFKGLKDSAFAGGIKAAVNWGDGFVYLFRGDEYWKYDALSDRADTPKPRKISDGWPTLPASFQTGIDAAFNSGTGRAYFFKGNEYLRYHIGDDRVDAPDPGTSPYPRDISDPNGWHGLTSAFNAGIDAAAFGGDGKIYFFKGPDYARLDFASRTVDVVSPAYPLSIATMWSGLPATIDAAVEWIEAGSATLKIDFPGTCQSLRNVSGIGDAVLGNTFTIEASFAATGHPIVCGSAEYRQFVQGSHFLDGKRVIELLPDPAGGPGIPMPPRPAPGAPDNFIEDGNKGTVLHYGHRHDPADPKGKYTNPDQRSGCRYEGSDTPIVNGRVGQSASVDLDFRGVIIDVNADDEVLVEKRWRVACFGVL
jgi:hypothetical protein